MKSYITVDHVIFTALCSNTMFMRSYGSSTRQNMPVSLQCSFCFMPATTLIDVPRCVAIPCLSVRLPRHLLPAPVICSSVCMWCASGLPFENYLFIAERLASPIALAPFPPSKRNRHILLSIVAPITSIWYAPSILFVSCIRRHLCGIYVQRCFTALCWDARLPLALSRSVRKPRATCFTPGQSTYRWFSCPDYRSHRVGNKAECLKEQTHQLGSQRKHPILRL